MSDRITVRRDLYRRLLVEAIENLETLCDAQSGSPDEGKLGTRELLAKARAEYKRAGGLPGPLDDPDAPTVTITELSRRQP